ncbi:hypothetical protein [Rhizobacter sp. SG703]|uniref:hypothetical protein n=1 Tax=Rhizobacter sp. SG703 TaxID=2587140 RepID=UPI001446AC8D|nr:hypothetical protein [Rhizobacter sp. SG703]NKI93495.1 hypothetical protein [Rhizobacter sp. SG703]
MSKDGTHVIFPTGRQGRVPYPRSLAGAPLFCLARRGSESELATLEEVEVQMGVASNVRIRRWGAGLTAEHQDVLLAIFRKLAGLEATLNAETNHQQRAYVEVQFSAKELLDILTKTYNKQNRDWLRRRLKDLSRSHLTVCAADAKPDSWPLFSGCILQFRAREKLTQGVRCSVSIPIEFVRLFQHMGYGQIDLEQRRKLGSSQLARLLQAHIECLKDRRTNAFFTYSVSKWMELTGTKSTEENFGSDLRKALKKLKEAEFLADYSVARGKVQLTLPRASRDAAQHVHRLPAPVALTRQPSVRLEGTRLRLGEEVPSIQELLGEAPWSNPLPVEVYFDGQLKAMMRLYPKVYANRTDLPPILARVETELARRDASPKHVQT